MVCRTRRAQPELVELTAVAAGRPDAAGAPSGRAWADRGGKGGKGNKDSYVCLAAACLEAVAARSPRSAEGGPGLLEDLAALGQARFLGMLGLERRQGSLLLGADRVDEARCMGATPVVYAANDAAERTVRRLRRGGELIVLPLSSEALGRAVGCARAAALGIVSQRLGQRAAYWLRVWYEAGRQSFGATARTNNIDNAAGERHSDDGRIEVA